MATEIVGLAVNGYITEGWTGAGAIFSPDLRYRYRLWRRVSLEKAAVLFVMLNPSTATATEDDPTIRRCVGFTRAWGYGRLEVANLFAYRSTDPAALDVVPDPVGPGNDAQLVSGAEQARLIVVAWGAQARCDRVAKVLGLLHRYAPGPICCLGKTKNGSPKHPLYVRGDVQPMSLLRVP